jgi:hypothetical protein
LSLDPGIRTIVSKRETGGVFCKGMIFGWEDRRLLVKNRDSTPRKTGWLSPPEAALEISRAAVATNYFPLWEAEYGKIKFTHEVRNPKPIQQFTKLMGSFFAPK